MRDAAVFLSNGGVGARWVEVCAVFLVFAERARVEVRTAQKGVGVLLGELGGWLRALVERTPADYWRTVLRLIGIRPLTVATKTVASIESREKEKEKQMECTV